MRSQSASFPRTRELLVAAQDAFTDYRLSEERKLQEEQGRYVSRGIQQGGVIHVQKRAVLRSRSGRFNFSSLLEKRKQQEQEALLSPKKSAPSPPPPEDTVQCAMLESRRLLIDVVQMQHQKLTKGKEEVKAHTHSQRLPEVSRPDTPDAVRQGESGVRRRKRKEETAEDLPQEGGQFVPRGDIVLDALTAQAVTKRLHQYIGKSHRRVQRCKFGTSRSDAMGPEMLAERCGSSLQSLLKKLCVTERDPPGGVIVRAEAPFKKQNVVTPRDDLDKDTSAMLTTRPPRQKIRRVQTATPQGDPLYPHISRAHRQRIVEEIDDECYFSDCEVDSPVFITQDSGFSPEVNGTLLLGVKEDSGETESLLSTKVVRSGSVTLPGVVRDLAVELSFQESGMDDGFSANRAGKATAKPCNHHNDGVLQESTQAANGGDTHSAETAGGRYCLSYRRVFDQNTETERKVAERIPFPYDAFKRELKHRDHAMHTRSLRELERCDHRRRIFFPQKYEVLAVVSDQAYDNNARFASWGPAADELNRMIVHVAVARDSAERKKRRDAFVSKAREIVSHNFPYVQDCIVLLDRLATLFDKEEERIRCAMAEASSEPGDEATHSPFAGSTASVLTPKLLFDLLSTFETSRFLQEGFCAVSLLIQPLFHVSEAMWQQYLKDRFATFQGASIDAIIEQHANNQKPRETSRHTPCRLKVKILSARGVDAGEDPGQAQMMAVLRSHHIFKDQKLKPSCPEIRLPTTPSTTKRVSEPFDTVGSGGVLAQDTISDPSELREEHKTSVVTGAKKTVWNEEFILALNDERAVLEFSVFDLRHVRDRPLGTATINVLSDSLKLRHNVRTRVSLTLKSNESNATKPKDNVDRDVLLSPIDISDQQVQDSMTTALAVSPAQRRNDQGRNGQGGELIVVLQPLNFCDARGEVRQRHRGKDRVSYAADTVAGTMDLIRRTASWRSKSTSVVEPPAGFAPCPPRSANPNKPETKNMRTVSIADGRLAT